MNLKITLVLLLFTSFSFAQLTVGSRGRVFDSNNKQLSPSEVRNILSTRLESLDLYDAARGKKTAGNVLLIAGAAFFVGDLATGLTQDKQYPGALTFVGLAAMIIAIPVKIGYSRKIRTAIDDFNKTNRTVSGRFTLDGSLCANQTGIGLKIKF